MTVNYREAYGMHAVNGILFNHESPRRGETFVTRKITRAATRIRYGLQDVLYLGNLDAQRDWGFAGDYVDAMWRMTSEAVTPEDYVIATGRKTSVRMWATWAFEIAGHPLHWRGCGADEQGIDEKGVVRVKIDPRFYRPAEVDLLQGDATKAWKELGWVHQVGPHALCQMMVSHDRDLAKKEAFAASYNSSVVPDDVFAQV
jgi:GDPmannose 4,6-dehydratase